MAPSAPADVYQPDQQEMKRERERERERERKRLEERGGGKEERRGYALE